MQRGSGPPSETSPFQENKAESRRSRRGQREELVQQMSSWLTLAFALPFLSLDNHLWSIR